MWRGRALFRKSAPPVDLVVLRHSGHRLATTLGTSSEIQKRIIAKDVYRKAGSP
jgi:hypothetical protein